MPNLSTSQEGYSLSGHKLATWSKAPAIRIKGKDVVIRRATAADTQRLFELIEELAIYERARDELVITKQHIYECCFGPKRFCGGFVAEWTDSENPDAKPLVIGLTLYFYRFHTWKGRQLYLEEFVVGEKYRGGGVGKRLFEAVIARAKELKCCGLFWQALDWNEPALNFYRKYKAEIDPQWMSCSLHFSKM